jgi:NDP-sugar pyrophosphorylase family protein
MMLYPVVILAGGLATRLRPITEKIPKALVEIGGKPFIYHQLRLLHSHGIRRVIISAWYRGDMIRDYVGNGSQFNMEVDYVFDGDSPLGTGGAIRKALPFLTSPFFVLYGDSYLPCDYAAIQSHFSACGLPALMTIFHNVGKWDTSNVEVANGRIAQYDKKNKSSRMEYIDYGLGLFVPSVFDGLEEGTPSDLADVYKKLVIEEKLLAYNVPERFYEIGSFEGMHELDELLAKDPDQFLKKE